jgi:hypothetical protein
MILKGFFGILATSDPISNAPTKSTVFQRIFPDWPHDFHLVAPSLVLSSPDELAVALDPATGHLDLAAGVTPRVAHVRIVDSNRHVSGRAPSASKRDAWR